MKNRSKVNIKTKQYLFKKYKGRATKKGRVKKEAFPASYVLRVSALIFGLVLVALIVAWAPWQARTYSSAEQKIGAGTVKSYVTKSAIGVPVAIGVTMTPGAREQLPAEPNNYSRCFDVNGDGVYGHHECIGDEERILELPAAAKGLKIPFKWITVNWNPLGHVAPYAVPHYDFHFFAADRERVEAIRPGTCGELANCDDFKHATQPLEPKYLPAGYIDVGAVLPRMGNHLFNSQSPELKDKKPFTHTFIYGVYEGDLTFWEPMITPNVFRQTRSGACYDIPQPKAFKQTGYYPTRYCIRQDAQTSDYTVSLENFVYAKGQ